MAIEQGLRRLRRAGTLVVVGMPPAGVTAQIEPLILADKGRHTVGSKMGSTRLRVDVPKLVRLCVTAARRGTRPPQVLTGAGPKWVAPGGSARSAKSSGSRCQAAE